MSEIRLALFDMDDVVYAYSRRDRIRHLVGVTGLDPDFIERRIWFDGLITETETGVFPTPEDCINAWRRRLGVDLSIDDWVAARAAGMVLDSGTLAIIDRLTAGGTTVAVLTNNDPLVDFGRRRLAPELEARVGDRFLVSSIFGTRKPDPAIYGAAVDHLGFAPAETVFIDDLPENVAGARAAGLHGLVFTSSDGLAADLARLGVPGVMKS